MAFKKFTLSLLLLAGVLFLSQCGIEGSKRNRKKHKVNLQNKAEAILTARTLGLAFLEENKLEEAEREFLRLIVLAPEESIVSLIK